VFYSDSSVTYAGPWVDDVVIWKGDVCSAIIRVGPPHKETLKNSFFCVDIVIENAVNLGAFELELTYDPSCVQLAGVILGPFLGSTGRSVADVGPTFGTGSVTYGAYSWGTSPGPNGNGILATVCFYAGTNACGTVLHPQNVSVADTAGNEQHACTEDGFVDVIDCPDPSCPEDLNCDGVINILDIQFVASKYGQHCPTRYPLEVPEEAVPMAGGR
jgi:hypothetical protein